MILMRHDNKELGLQNRHFLSRFSGDHEADVDRETRATGARYFFPRDSPLRVSRTPRLLRARPKNAKERAEWNHRGEYNS